MRILTDGESASDNERVIHTGNPHHDRQRCPRCGSQDLTVTAGHSSRGYNGYRCNACGCQFAN
ncbi:MAG: hypothetical protein SVR04_00175 [Spirochaetota bacterium]|nr:hypothetical protein [Spirochaetota bacterium]